MTEQVARSRHGHTTRPHGDFYRTPENSTVALHKRELFLGKIWEPACGDGAISKVLERKGYDVYSSDLYDRGYGDAPIDFLEIWTIPDDVLSVVTNPPYLLAEKFALHAVATLKVPKVAMLCRLLWLEGSGRRERLFGPHPPARIYVHSSRIRTQRGDVAQDEVGMMTAFAWFVWDKEHRGETIVRWIP